ncbi:VCBS domain-containing protein [Vibrio vulnificus]|uniref:VCBS domain-containing protein n=1 Tax=Vibrio vulnificus TaxID=672 RepID=UPI0012AE6664|nr:VCBS domain-containing protein [Vibrio vulnificus]
MQTVLTASIASSYDSLKAGEEQVITIPVVVTDDQGATAETTLTITVTGTNDAPTATAATGSVTEDASITAASVQKTWICQRVRA